MSRGRLAFLGAVLLAAACTQELTAPGRCPDYCPAGQIVVRDTLLAASISRDSSFRGYVSAQGVGVMLAADLPGIVDSRPFFRFAALGQRLSISTKDTTTGAVVGSDSARLQFSLTRRDTATHDLTIRLYRLPVTIDSATAFADLVGPFIDSLVRTVNVDSLLAKAAHKDIVTGDSAHVDTVTHAVTLSLKLDSSQARYVAVDSGKVAYGVRVSADSLATITLSKVVGLGLQWYVEVDSLGTRAHRTSSSLTATVASFVFDPPAAAIDSTLAVGGVPSARSILRVAFPRAIRDSARVIRGTLILVPAVAARGSSADTFAIETNPVIADFGAKSPILVDVSHTDTTVIRFGATDTVQIEITNLLQFWAADTTRPPAIVLRALPEATNFPEIRFYPSAAAAVRPAIRVTYTQPFPFGKP